MVVSASDGERMLPNAYQGERKLNSSSLWCDNQLCSRLYIPKIAFEDSLCLNAWKHCHYFKHHCAVFREWQVPSRAVV